MIDTVSFGEFARLLGVSEPTLRKRLPEAPDGVILSRGNNGEAYQIDPRAGVAWWKSIAAAAEAALLSRTEQLDQLKLELIGDDAALGDHDLAGMTPGEQKSQLEAELAAIKLGQLRGELVRADDVEANDAKFKLAVKEKLESLTDRLRKRAEITPEAAAALDRLIQRDLHDLADVAESFKEQPAQEIIFAPTEGTATGRGVPQLGEYSPG